MDGLLNVWKPPGPTSFDVVRRLRRAGASRPIGHGGTLDPLAEGVLPVLVGQGTRLAELFEGCAKAYRAQILLGLQTDTFDIQGRVLRQADPSEVTFSAITALLPSFTGRILQRPPLFSALKRGGQPLYRLARQGVEVEPEPRPVLVYQITLSSWVPPRLTLEVVCGKGTYIRSLAADLGERLGCGAALEGLVRTRVGPFRAEEALHLEEVEDRLRAGQGASLLAPFELLFSGWPALHVHPSFLPRVLAGASLGPESGTWGQVSPSPLGEPPYLPPPPLDRAVAYGPDGRLLALLVSEGTDHWRPRKVLAVAQGSERAL